MLQKLFFTAAQNSFECSVHISLLLFCISTIFFSIDLIVICLHFELLQRILRFLQWLCCCGVCNAQTCEPEIMINSLKFSYDMHIKKWLQYKLFAFQKNHSNNEL